MFSDVCTSQNITDLDAIKSKVTYVNKPPPSQELPTDDDSDDTEEGEEKEDDIKEGVDDDDMDAGLDKEEL